MGAIMEGETNQVKVMMEEALLTLANVVIEELNNGNGTRRLRVLELRRKRRELLVKEATNVTVTDVQDVRKCGYFVLDIQSCCLVDILQY